MRRFVICFLLLSLPLAAASDEVFRVYSEHPRLFLGPRRLHVLRKEPGRQAMRWEQFAELLKGGAQPPEPGFAWALFYEITGDKTAARRAIEWALAAQRRPSDLRQLALVYDWCQDALAPREANALFTRIRGFLNPPPASSSLPAERDRILAAISIAERDQDLAEKILRDAVETWWRKRFAPALGTAGHSPVGGELFPLLEILHAVRDNLNIDLRESNVAYFASLPGFMVASHYPASYPAAENEYRIPVFFHSGEPSLEDAALSRAAGLAWVSFDSNSTASQFLQGWLIQDRFQLRGAFGSPYEFLWANPYQPGLAYAQLPLVFYDAKSGTLFARSSWEEDAAWFGLINGKMQLFENGRVKEITGAGSGGKGSIDLGSSLILQGRVPMRFAAENQDVFVVGLQPDTAYDVEVDDEEMRERKTDASGVLEFHLHAGGKRSVWIHAIMTPPAARPKR